MMWSSRFDPVPPILNVSGLALTAARYSFGVLYGVSEFTHRMNWSWAIKATGVRSRQLNTRSVASGRVEMGEGATRSLWGSAALVLCVAVAMCFYASPMLAGTTSTAGFVAPRAQASVQNDAANSVASPTRLPKA